MNIAFWGTPELCIPILEALKNAGQKPVVIVTQPDRKEGRKMILTSPATKLWAEKNNIPVLQPEKLDAIFLEELSQYSVDISVVVAYGKIIPEAVLAGAKYGFVNLHYSLLPRFRGATPVEAAILAGDTVSGITIQKMVYELDAGPILYQEKISIEDDETGIAYRNRLNEHAAQVLPEVIKDYVKGNITPIEQETSDITKCGKIQKEDGHINFPNGDDIENYRKYRAYFGWPGVFFTLLKDGKPLRVIIKQATFENGKFTPTIVQMEGKKEMDFTNFKKQFLN